MKTKKITMTALCIALTFVATACINVRIPFLASNGGLIHLGNVPLFLAAALFGKKMGAAAGAFGMAMFDLSCGWVAWAPFTFIICGLIGYVFGIICFQKSKKRYFVAGIVTAVAIKVAGYYIAEGILYGNWIAPVTSIPGNIVQIGVAGMIALPVVFALKSMLKDVLCEWR